MGREVGGRFKREGIYIYLWLIHVEVWQKTTKFCKAIILQLKNNFLKKKWKKVKKKKKKRLAFTWHLSKQGLAVFNICLFAFGCTGSSLLPSGFLSLGRQRLLFVALQASHLRWLLLLWSGGSRWADFRSCSTWAPWWWYMGLAAPWPVESSQNKDWTSVRCTGRQILIHWATREVQLGSIFKRIDQ